MKKTIAIIHFNTPELTECCIMSIRKHGCDWPVVVFDNSADITIPAGTNGNGPKEDTVIKARPFKQKMKGVKAMREGAMDAYDTVMFRCRFIKQLDRWCLLKFKGNWYQITSFNDDYQDNQIQITATELANQQVNIVEPTPEPEPTPTPTPDPEPTPEPTENESE